jgi:hypothetical protein
MRRVVISLGVLALAVILAGAPAFADTAAPPSAPQTGTVTAVEEEVVRIKGADGKEYTVDVTVVAAENLKTGDIVEYGVVNEKPVRVKKKAAK